MMFQSAQFTGLALSAWLALAAAPAAAQPAAPAPATAPVAVAEAAQDPTPAAMPGMPGMPKVAMAQPAPPEAPPPPPPPPASSGWAVLSGEGRSFLGVGVQEVTAERAKALKLKDEYGVEITSVQDDSPAARAGLKTGDIVLDYNGQRVEGTEQFIRMVRETPVGRTVKLQISRGGSTQSISAVVAARKGPQVFSYGGGSPMKIEIPNFSVNIPDIPKAMMSWRSPMLGVEAESLGDSQLSAYFGVKEGVLVRSVNKGSAAEKAGIKAGDVILKVDETKVTSPRDISAALRASREGTKKTVPVVLMRERKETTLSVTLDEEPGGRTIRPRSTSVRHLNL